jgi:putative membrane protein insertion efficiency factor
MQRKTAVSKNGLKQAGIFICLLPVYVYKYGISPWTPAMCRYSPSCSTYAIIAVKKYGPFKGGWLALKRILRCHPWGGHGYDPVP